MLEADGSVLPAAVSCVSVALASAGVELFGLVAACGACMVGNQFLVDPDSRETLAAAGSLSLGFMPALQQVTFIAQAGLIDEKHMSPMMELALDGCVRV